MFCNCIFNEKRLGMNHPSLKFAFFTLRFTEEPLCPGSLQTFDVTIRKFLCFLYFRFAKVPNARLGHIHASMVATLALRICHHAPAASSLATWQYASSFVFSSRKWRLEPSQ